jgi:hypothetical protein
MSRRSLAPVVRAAVLAMVGVVLGVALNSALAGRRFEAMLESAEILVVPDEHDPIALRIDYPDEGVPIRRLEVFREGEGVPRGGRVWMKGSEVPLSISVDGRRASEVQGAQGARATFEHRADGTVVATVSASDGSAATTHEVKLSVRLPEGEPARGWRRAAGASLIGTAHAQTRPDRTIGIGKDVRMEVTRMLRVPIVAKAGPRFGRQHGLPALLARCDARDVTCWAVGGPVDATGTPTDRTVFLQAAVSMNDVPEPTEDELRPFLDVSMDKLEKDTATGVLNAVQLLAVICAAATSPAPPVAALCVGMIPAGSVATVAGIVWWATDQLGWTGGPSKRALAVARLSFRYDHARRRGEALLAAARRMQICAHHDRFETSCVEAQLPNVVHVELGARLAARHELTLNLRAGDGTSGNEADSAAPGKEATADTCPTTLHLRLESGPEIVVYRRHRADVITKGSAFLCGYVNHALDVRGERGSRVAISIVYRSREKGGASSGACGAAGSMVSKGTAGNVLASTSRQLEVHWVSSGHLPAEKAQVLEAVLAAAVQQGVGSPCRR